MTEDMRLRHVEELRHEVSTPTNNHQLSSALTYARRRMGFDHFAVIYDQWIGCTAGPSLLIHDYPDQWANAYISFGLGIAIRYVAPVGNPSKVSSGAKSAG